MNSLAQRLDIVRVLGIFSSLLLVFCMVSVGRADLIAYEGFDYANGDLRGEEGEENDGGEGDWTGPWSAGSGSGDGFSWQVGPPSLGYTDSGGRALVTTGRSVEADGGEHRETRPWNTAGHKDDGDVVWFSFLFGSNTGPSAGHHIFIVGENHDNGMGVFINETTISARINNQGVAFGGGHKFFTAGEDHFVVGRITFSDAMEDEVRFWLDPELDAIPLDTAVNSGATSVAVDASGWSNLYIRKFGSGVDLLDEFRIGTDFFSVVPVPEPSSLAFVGLAALVALMGHVSRRKGSRRPNERAQ